MVSQYYRYHRNINRYRSLKKYWSDLKAKLAKEGSELSQKIGQLKLQAADGKSYALSMLFQFLLATRQFRDSEIIGKF